MIRSQLIEIGDHAALAESHQVVIDRLRQTVILLGLDRSAPSQEIIDNIGKLRTARGDIAFPQPIDVEIDALHCVTQRLAHELLAHHCARRSPETAYFAVFQYLVPDLNVIVTSCGPTETTPPVDPLPGLAPSVAVEGDVHVRECATEVWTLRLPSWHLPFDFVSRLCQVQREPGKGDIGSDYTSLTPVAPIWLLRRTKSTRPRLRLAAAAACLGLRCLREKRWNLVDLSEPTTGSPLASSAGGRGWDRRRPPSWQAPRSRGCTRLVGANDGPSLCRVDPGVERGDPLASRQAKSG